ncbi:uncharacterized protein CXorf66 homolog [Glossophaga mutica]
MNLFIYVLLLSIWTSSCLNTNRSGGSSTTASSTGTKDPDLEPTTLTKMDDFRKHLHVHIIGITCTAFIILSVCFLHYNCLNDDFPKAEAAVRPPSPASLQYPLLPTEKHYQTCPQNRILLLKSSSFQKYTKSPRYPNLKRSFSTSMVDMLSKSQLVNSCQFYGGKNFVCRNTSESFVNDISEAKKRNVQSPPFLYKVKPFAKSFNNVNSKDNAFYGNMSDSDKMIYDNDGDGERKITIISD